MIKKEDKIKGPLQRALQVFETNTKSPTDYLKEQKEFAEKNRLLLKSLFDYAKASGPHFQSKTLPDEIFVEHMDEEQIWQQLEMQNDSFWEKCMSETCRLLSLNENKLTFKVNYPGQEHATQENGNEANEVEESDGYGDSVQNESGEEVEDKEDEEDEEEGDEDEESVGDSDVDGETDEDSTVKASKTKAAVDDDQFVDDQFFKISEMEAFLDNEDKKELDRLNGKRPKQGDSEDEIDYFDSLSDAEDSDDETEIGAKGKDMMFADFFDAEDQGKVETPEEIRQRRRAEKEEKNRRKKQQMKEDLGLDDSEAENSETDGNLLEQEESDHNESDDDEVEKSEFDLRQQRLKKRIEELEEKALGEKPWQLKGEITSSTRPKNSLLEEVLEFDSVARPPPLITEETTLCLEEIIKRRIKSKAWDDVERKIKPINDQQDFRKSLVLQQEKSKESLAQIYEKDYLEKVHKLNNLDDDTKTDEPPEHKDIRKAMKDLFIKLDALSNFHFTSKPVAAEARIITNIPAIEMEEVAPVAISDATLLAPEEVRTRPVGDEIGKTERTDTDKKRERRKKKNKQKLMKQRNDKRVEEKVKQGIKVTTKEKQQQLLNQVTKSRNVIKGKSSTNDENKALKSSKSFFTQLQDNISSTVKSKSLGKKKSRGDLTKDESSAKRFKL
ncbi:U3 small nucleolar ribonucleoprotein protein MPP10 [Contarinia nasturtii]|uniref:U3 small nucleolar ribonucleoprotein protein MPP10 n=1 Tax=Contarinia nasturtii TaxID=265458 RepID=UPI0012D39B8A|nr:U3 small nucleolar ribonucleoprotein protein MPP10 [Contarinia nasturtii]